MRNRWLKITAYFFSALILLISGLVVYVVAVSKLEPPHPESSDCLNWRRSQGDSGLLTVQNNWLRKSECGLYEMYVEGKPFERGVAIGKLTRELAHYQEEVFVKQLRQLVPSKLKLTFLKYFVGW